jgi:hypothetical protein
VNEHQPFFQDDEDDTLLFETLQQHVLETYPNPERIGCLDHTTLETWVRSPEKLDLSDPKYLHVLKCAECTRDLIELRRFRKKQKEQSEPATSIPPARVNGNAHASWRWAAWSTALALCIVLVAAMAFWKSHSGNHGSQGVQEVAISETIDLSHAGTLRGGEASTVPAINLPRRIVALHVVLPYFSPGGNYDVSVAKDRDSESAKAEGRGVASAQGMHADLSVTLDLRRLRPGTYYLATTHEGDPSSYFYPLTIQ